MKNSNLVFGTFFAVAAALALAGEATFAQTTPPSPPSPAPVPTASKDVVEKMKIFYRTTNTPIDILWVVQNSGSHEPQRVVAAAKGIFDELAVKKDWRMAMVSTDENNLASIGFRGVTLDSSTPQPDLVFGEWVKSLGIASNPIEAPFTTTYMALEQFPDFFRPGAALAIIVVSDAPEQSLSQATNLNISAAKLVAKIKSVKTAGGFVSFYPIVSSLDGGCQAEGTPFRLRESPYDIVNKTFFGHDFALCTFQLGEDYRYGANSLGKGIAASMEYGPSRTYSSFQLAELPDLMTLTLEYGGKLLPEGSRAQNGLWMYDFQTNSIHLNDMQFRQWGLIDEITIRYTAR